MRCANFIGFLTLFIGSLCPVTFVSAQAVFPKPFPVPTDGTDWTPEGCRQTYSA